MQKINHAFFGMLMLTSMNAYTTNIQLLENATKALAACNQAAQSTSSSPAQCIFKALVPQTKELALDTITDEITDKKRQLTALENKLEDTTHADERHELQGRINVFIKGIGQLESTKKGLQLTPEDQYKTNITGLSDVEFMEQTMGKVMNASGYSAMLRNKIPSAVTPEKVHAIAHEKWVIDLYIHENTRSLNAVLASWDAELDRLKALENATVDAKEKDALHEKWKALGQQHDFYSRQYKDLLFLCNLEK